MNAIFIQAIYYGVVMILTLVLLGVLMRGFMWKFIKVKISFGRLLMVKVKAINRDYYAVGRIDEGFLIYKVKKAQKRIDVPDPACFYRSLGVTWVDVDEEKNCVFKPDHSAVKGFDAIKYNNLYKRTLYQPQIADNKEKLIIGAIIICIIISAATLFFLYKQSAVVGQIFQKISEIKANTITPGANI